MSHLFIPDHIRRSLPQMVQSALQEMGEQRQAEFLEDYGRRTKSIAIGYLLWLIGWHYAYYRKWGVFLLFWVTLGGFMVWWFVDLFRVPGITTEYNRDIAVEVARNLRVLSGGGRV